MSPAVVEVLGILAVIAGAALLVTGAALVSLVAALVTGGVLINAVGVVLVVTANKAAARRAAGPVTPR